MYLIIVESPTKSKTLERFLSNEYQVAATKGHIRDLPQKKLGVDIENDFKPEYVTVPGKGKVIKKLKKLSQKTEQVILALDLDREGEAIAWHVQQILGLDGKPYQRIVFHEITKQALEKALQNPGKIDMDLVQAQKARRILDRIVGYKLSPFLWKKVVKGLSAGRVQSVAVRLIVEREREIEAFDPKEYWTIVASLLKIKNQKAKIKKNKFEAKLIRKNGKKIGRFDIENEKQAQEIVKDLKDAEYKIESIQKKKTRRYPYPPFTTSTLQRESSSKCNFSAKFTMALAQQLYEMGLITYHRTDSLNLSQSSLKKAGQFISKNFGKKYWRKHSYQTKSKTAQEAHEAIRPTSPKKKPKSVKIKKELSEPQFKLYDLIWRRFLACQMSPAVFDSTKVEIKSGNYTFRARGRTLRFDGFLKVYPVQYKQAVLPSLQKGQHLKLIKLIPSQHFTKPPARYSEATLIKELKKNGVGRPSTFAPILSVIEDRNYVRKNSNKRFAPTEMGEVVNDLLVEHFPKIVDVKFTAQMEQDLDQIAQGEKQWTKILKDFYRPFEKNLKQKYKEVKKQKPEQKTQKKCPECGAPLVLRYGKYGKFYGCSDFPDCSYTEPFEEKTGVKCPQCGEGQIIEKKSKKGNIFYSCNQWPDCDFSLWNEPTGEKCPECGSLLVKNKGRIVCSNKDCDFVEK